MSAARTCTADRVREGEWINVGFVDDPIWVEVERASTSDWGRTTFTLAKHHNRRVFSSDRWFAVRDSHPSTGRGDDQ